MGMNAHPARYHQPHNRVVTVRRVKDFHEPIIARLEALIQPKCACNTCDQLTQAVKELKEMTS